jgi:hypothetical protein
MDGEEIFNVLCGQPDRAGIGRDQVCLTPMHDPSILHQSTIADPFSLLLNVSRFCRPQLPTARCGGECDDR